MEEFKTYLESKSLSTTTVTAYQWQVERFILWYGKDAVGCTKKDVLNYLGYLKNSQAQQNITRRNSLIALSHYFTFLAQNQLISTPPTALIKIRGTHKKHLYNTYTSIELEQLHDNFYHTFIRVFDNSHMPKNQWQHNFLSRQRNYIMLGFLTFQGLHTNELGRIKLGDLDLNKAQVHVKGSKKTNERNLPLNAVQIGTLMDYLNTIRPQFLALCGDSDQLFLPLPKVGENNTENKNIMSVFKPLSKQVKSISGQFSQFEQVRASVIAYWIKTEGLRRAQYLAGHHYISSTEKYQANDLENLTDDITKYNTF